MVKRVNGKKKFREKINLFTGPIKNMGASIVTLGIKF